MGREGHLFKGSEGCSGPSYFLLLRVPRFTHFLGPTALRERRQPDHPTSERGGNDVRGQSPAAVRLRAAPGHAPFGAPPQPRLLARKCARAPAKWRLRPSRCGLSASCPACCSSCPSATFCPAMVSSRLGAAPSELVSRGSPEPREAGDRRRTALQPSRKARVPCVGSPGPESTRSFPFHEPYLPSAAPTC